MKKIINSAKSIGFPPSITSLTKYRPFMALAYLCFVFLFLQAASPTAHSQVSVPYGPEIFELGQGQWTAFSVAGNRNWTRSSTTLPANSFMEINSFNGDVPSNDWLILGPFDFSGVSNLVSQFSVQRAFDGDENEMNLKVSSNYSGTGDPSLATWTTVPFTKPATVSSGSGQFFSSGSVSLPASISGLNGVYIAFHHNPASLNPTSRWRIDNFQLLSSVQPLLTVTCPSGSINEGQSATGTVTLPEAVAEDVFITITSADPSEILVDGEGTGAAASTSVVIFSGSTSADFSIEVPLDGVVDEDQEVQVVAEAVGYEFGQLAILSRNIDLPSAALTESGYSQDFLGYTSAETPLPLGWSAVGPDLTYDGDFGTGTTGGFRGNASVFGYQHTGTTGDLQQILTLRNETGAEINNLTISYVGRLARADQGRSPAYAVTVNGQVVGGLAYTTAPSGGGDGTLREESISGLAIAPNQVFTIVWASQRGAGSGSSKQIGISNVNVAVGASQFPPTLSGVSIPAGSIGENEAQLNSEVTSDGSAAIISRGFVYSIASLNPNPEIGGANVTVVTDSEAQVGPMTSTISGLVSNTVYSVKSFATNSEGTSYSGVQTFSTLEPALLFNGNYSQIFDAFEGTVPPSWRAISSAGIQGYVGTWGSGTAGGFLGGQSAPGVLGYQHTASTGALTVTLRLVNNTGAELNELFISYLGRVSRILETRIPTWTVSVNGTAIPELAYSTDNMAGPEGVPGDMSISSAVTGLAIAAGEEFSITWVSDRGIDAGSSRQIGLADVVVSTSNPANEPVISGDLVITGIVGSPITPYQIIASGSPTSYGSGALPDGLFLNEETGVISGIPSGVSTGVIVQISATNGSGTGTADLAINIEQDTATFAFWSGGLPATPELVEAYAIGGASGPLEAGEAPVVAVEGGNLTLTAIVRTDDPDLTIVGVATADLAVAFTSTDVTSTTAGVNQDGVPAGTERRKYSVPIGSGSKKFLRLNTILAE